MKTIIFIFCFVFAVSIMFAQTKTIHFETDSFAVIKAKARKENKLIFVDAYTVWCGPCKWMAKNIFTNDTVADYFNSEFINVQIDMEKGEGVEIAKLYEVYCYPNLLFIDGDGNLVHRGAGALNVKSFIQLAVDAQNPEKRFSKYRNEYESKRSDPKFLYEYLYVISKTCLPIKDIVIDYFKTQKKEYLSDRANWNIIRDFISDYKCNEFNYLLNHEKTFGNLYTADSVNMKIKDVFLNNGYNLFYKPDFKDDDYLLYKNEILNFSYTNRDEILNEMLTFNFTVREEILFRLDMAYFEKKEDWKKYIALVIEKGDVYFNSLGDFNNISWNIYEHSDDVIALKKAMEWMQNTLKDKDSQQWFAYDTYAALLFKLKKKQEAKTAALKAIELAKVSGISEDEYKPTRELLERIEKMN